jgi:hypothetical protein
MLREVNRLRVFEKRQDVTGRWRKLYNEEFRYMYPSPRIIKITKSRRMRRAERVA